MCLSSASVRDQSLMHEAEEHVHPFEYTFDLQDLDGVLKMREMDLQKILAFVGAIEA